MLIFDVDTIAPASGLDQFHMPLLAGEAEKATEKLRSSKSLPSLGRLSGVALKVNLYQV